MPNDRFYHTPAWKALRLQRLQRDHYYCQPCKRAGRFFISANTVHHRKPREQYPELALDIENVESICPACHNKNHPEKAFKRNSNPKQPFNRVRVIKM